MYELNYQDPYEQQQAQLQALQDPYVPATDFGRVSMGQAPATNEAPIEEQVQTAQTMDQANIAAAGGIGEAVQAARPYAYTTEGATDSEALGEGMFAFGLAMLASASQPGANFGNSLAAGLGEGAKGFTNALNRNKRYENREALERKGFTQESIDAYIKSGDNKQLVKAPKPDNFMKTKEMGGVMYEYDERDPASTMKPIAMGPRQIKSSVDLGDRVQIHYTDGSTEIQSKGMTAGERQRAATAAGRARESVSKPKWETGLYEYKDPESGAMRVREYTYDANSHPAERQFYEGGVAVPQLPVGGRFTSETQQRLRAENRLKAEEKTGNLGNAVSAATQNINKLNDNAIHLLNLNRYNPFSEDWERSNTADAAKSALMVQQYSSMPGVAGASVQTEEALIKAIPTKFQTEKGIAEWTMDRLDYDESVVKASIRQQQRAYEYNDPALDTALETIRAQREKTKAKLEELNKKGSKGAVATGPKVRAPGSTNAPQSAYGGAAQAQVQSFDPSQVKLIN